MMKLYMVNVHYSVKCPEMRGKNLLIYVRQLWLYVGLSGKKLLFMGNEFAQGREWNYQESLDWYLLDEIHGGGWHKAIQDYVRDLNHIYQKCTAL